MGGYSKITMETDYNIKEVIRKLGTINKKLDK